MRVCWKTYTVPHERFTLHFSCMHTRETVLEWSWLLLRSSPSRLRLSLYNFNNNNNKNVSNYSYASLMSFNVHERVMNSSSSSSSRAHWNDALEERTKNPVCLSNASIKRKVHFTWSGKKDSLIMQIIDSNWVRSRFCSKQFHKTKLNLVSGPYRNGDACFVFNF